MTESSEKIKLTQYAKATGCSCKIAPAQLREILASSTPGVFTENLIVGNSTSDDAAVYKLNDEIALIATTDFFTPVVDDAYDYGRIAAANALSDVYAMGGKPLLALAILGWPVDVLPPALASAVLEGARAACVEAGIPLAGGHSIITSEPVFGLSVNGMVANKNLKRNSTAQEGDMLLLTRAIGSGILTTANKRGLLEENEYAELLAQLTRLNNIGEQLGNIQGITAMTDVTGFGLGGHLYEMATGSGLTAQLQWSKVPLMEISKSYAAQRISPDATFRNWNSISAEVAFGEGVNVMEAFAYLPDPQTNGGLLIAVSPDALNEVQALLTANDYSTFTQPIGSFVAKEAKSILLLS